MGRGILRFGGLVAGLVAGIYLILLVTAVLRHPRMVVWKDSADGRRRAGVAVTPSFGYADPIDVVCCAFGSESTVDSRVFVTDCVSGAMIGWREFESMEDCPEDAAATQIDWRSDGSVRFESRRGRVVTIPAPK